MIDTILLESPFISEKIASVIERESIIRQGIDMSMGEIFYQITTKELKGSYDSSLRIVVKRDKYESTFDLLSRKVITNLVKCEPYLLVECSVHKLILGHNCYGGTNNFHGLCKFLINFLEKNFNFELPNYEIWKVRRVDYAEVFDLGCLEAVVEWFRGVNNAHYSRRKVIKYANEGLYFPGSTTTLKFYAKGVEFNKHDKPRLKKFLDDDSIFNIQDIANKLLRVELEVKSKKLKNDFKTKDLPLVKDIKVEYLQSLYEIEVQRVLKEGAEGMKIIRDATNVQQRLYSNCSSQKAGSLLGTWYMLSTLGEEYAKSQMSKATFYRHRKELQELGISWLGTNVTLKSSSILPVNFTPSIEDSRKLYFTDKKILRLLSA